MPPADRVPDAEAVPLVTVEEAAQWLRISRSSAYELIGRGELPTIRVGRRLRVPVAALRRLLQLDPPLPEGDPAAVVPLRQEGA